MAHVLWVVSIVEHNNGHFDIYRYDTIHQDQVISTRAGRGLRIMRPGRGQLLPPYYLGSKIEFGFETKEFGFVYR